jgi:malonyl-CoA O-methyltransferase
LKSRLEYIVPANYDQAAVIVREAGNHLLARLDLAALRPRCILDLGCAAGHCTQLLSQRYPEAELVAVEDSLPMLEYAQSHVTAPVRWMYAPLDPLPVGPQSVDLLVVNLLLPWCVNLHQTLQEWRRVLRPAGLVMLSSLGPDTLREVNTPAGEMPRWTDMHPLGDALLQAGFSAPVLDVQHFTLAYPDPQSMEHELRVVGLLSESQERLPLEKNPEGFFTVTYEVIYGHAWQPSAGQNRMAPDGTIKIPVEQLRRAKDF